MRRSRRLALAMTLVEVLIAMGVLVITGIGGYSGFLLLNRYASNLRNMSRARALCQERIEQGLSLPFRPTAIVPTFPAAPSADPTVSSPTPCPILGTSSNYTSGAFTGSNVQTSKETIPVLMQSENTLTSGASNVTYTRTTTVSPAAFYLMTASGGKVSATTTSLNMIQMTVTVSWIYRGTTYSTSMSTLRAQDH